ncbi:MAG TPA: TIM barrel protein [Methylomirabilota bacterium]|nr:TIM barrel protein [Methylomirabilota bacterium]
MILGLSSYTYGWAIGVAGYPPARPLTEQDLLDRARRHRVSLVQVCDNLPLHQLSSERLTAFAERAAREAIALEVGSRGLTLPHAMEMIALARRVGARLIRFVIDGPEHHPERREVIDVLRRLVPALDGLTLGIENHDRRPARELRSIVEAVDSERVGICLDTANSLGAGEGLACVVGTLAPFTVNLHLKDFQIARVPHLMGFTVEGRPAGAGMLDVPWLLEQLAPFGRCRTAVLELWTPPEADLASTIAREESWVEQSLNYLKPLFKARA